MKAYAGASLIAAVVLGASVTAAAQTVPPPIPPPPVRADAPAARENPPPSRSWFGDANVFLGRKDLNEDDWDPTDRQGELGIETNWQAPNWPVALAADLLFSGDEEDYDHGPFTRQRGRTSEFDVGARKVWRPGDRVRPYLGGGLALVSANLRRTGPGITVEDSDDGAGLWLGGGVFWTLNQAFNVGLDARLSAARVRLLDETRNAGGFHLGVLLGYHWGG